MVNMTDGKSDGLMLAYIEDGVAYPVSLTKEQIEMLDVTVGVVLEELRIIYKPMGKVYAIDKE